MDNWKPVHYLVIHVHCVCSWYLKDRLEAAQVVLNILSPLNLN
jgi:hypothetical protein